MWHPCHEDNQSEQKSTMVTRDSAGMYLPEPNPCFLFLRFAMCHWHAKNQHLRFSVRYWGKTSLLVLLYLKAKYIQWLWIWFFCLSPANTTAMAVCQSQFSPPMEITTCLAKFTLWGCPQLYDFFISQHQQARRLASQKSHPAFYFPYFFCPHIPSRHQKRPFTASQVTQQAPSLPICFRK